MRWEYPTWASTAGGSAARIARFVGAGDQPDDRWGRAISVRGNRARRARETGPWGPIVGAAERLRAVETWWAAQEGMLPGPKREVDQPKMHSVLFLFLFLFPFS
jgi:hypothetical protein